MIEALIAGKLVKDPELKTSGGGVQYSHFLLSVPIGEEQPVIVSGVAFKDVAEGIAKLKKGDALSVAGSLKPSEWNDKATGETKHGLNVTVSHFLSAYDSQKRKPGE